MALAETLSVYHGKRVLLRRSDEPEFDDDDGRTVE